MADSVPEGSPKTTSTLEAALTSAADDGKLSCAAAFEVAQQIGVSPTETGQVLDNIGIRLKRCQLGLFGHGPGKKAIVMPETIPPALAEAIQHYSRHGCLACKDAWHIADRFDWAKPVVAGACDQLSVKIKPCQLGAF